MSAEREAAEQIDWSKPCPAPLRCADQVYCPPACQRAGNREGNVRYYREEWKP